MADETEKEIPAEPEEAEPAAAADPQAEAPDENAEKIAELSAEITKGMEILFVESMDEVLKAAMGRKRK